MPGALSAPQAVLGHGVGELVAACVAGAMSVDDGLLLVAERARLMTGEALLFSAPPVLPCKPRAAGSLRHRCSSRRGAQW